MKNIIPQMTYLLLLIPSLSAAPIQKGLPTIPRSHLPACARAGVLEVWLLNLVDGRLEAVWKPAGGAYQDAMVLNAPGTLTSRAVPGLSVPGAGLIG